MKCQDGKVQEVKTMSEVELNETEKELMKKLTLMRAGVSAVKERAIKNMEAAVLLEEELTKIENMILELALEAEKRKRG